MILGAERVALKTLERWVGKVSFAQGMRTATRSSFEFVYVWIDQHRRRNLWGGALWPVVVSELVLAMLELPAMRINMAAPWNPRVEASDASPGGHSRAWSWMDTKKVAHIARLVEGKGTYTNLDLDYGLEVSDGVCALSQVVIDEQNYK